MFKIPLSPGIYNTTEIFVLSLPIFPQPRSSTVPFPYLVLEQSPAKGRDSWIWTRNCLKYIKVLLQKANLRCKRSWVSILWILRVWEIRKESGRKDMRRKKKRKEIRKNENAGKEERGREGKKWLAVIQLSSLVTTRRKSPIARHCLPLSVQLSWSLYLL